MAVSTPGGQGQRLASEKQLGMKALGPLESQWQKQAVIKESSSFLAGLRPLSRETVLQTPVLSMRQIQRGHTLTPFLLPHLGRLHFLSVPAPENRQAGCGERRSPAPRQPSASLLTSPELDLVCLPVSGLLRTLFCFRWVAAGPTSS